MQSTILDHLATLIHEVTGLPRELVRPSASIDNELEMKSVDFMKILVALEEDFDVDLDPLVILDLNQVEKICGYIETNIRENCSAETK